MHMVWQIGRSMIGLAGIALAFSATAAEDQSRVLHTPAFKASQQSFIRVNNDVRGGCAGQLITDSGFEATDPGDLSNPNWTSTSTNFGTALCNSAVCGAAATAIPHAGTFWAWLGGINAAAESATVSQTVNVPAPGPRYLNFFLWIGTVNTPFTDTLVVNVDGNPVRTFAEPAVAEVGYVQRSIDISAFVGGSHIFEFAYTHPAAGGTANFNLDDVTIDCVQLPVSLQSYRVD